MRKTRFDAICRPIFFYFNRYFEVEEYRSLLHTLNILSYWNLTVSKWLLKKLCYTKHFCDNVYYSFSSQFWSQIQFTIETDNINQKIKLIRYHTIESSAVTHTPPPEKIIYDLQNSKQYMVMCQNTTHKTLTAKKKVEVLIINQRNPLLSGDNKRCRCSMKSYELLKQLIGPLYDGLQRCDPLMCCNNS